MFNKKQNTVIPAEAIIPDCRNPTKEFLNDRNCDVLIETKDLFTIHEHQDHGVFCKEKEIKVKLSDKNVSAEKMVEALKKLALKRFNKNEDLKPLYIIHYIWNERQNKFDKQKYQLFCNYKRYLETPKRKESVQN